MQIERVDVARAKQEDLSSAMEEDTTQDFTQHSEMRCYRRHMRLHRLYGAQEVLLELAILTVILGLTFGVCLLRRQLAG